MTTCTECDRTAVCRGWCKSHYDRWLRTGDPLPKPRPFGSDRERRLVTLYGITEAEYQALLEAQGGVCAICKQPERRRRRGKGDLIPLPVDHNHRTGRVRGLVCHRCNIRIGCLEDREWLAAALAYLDREAA